MLPNPPYITFLSRLSGNWERSLKNSFHRKSVSKAIHTPSLTPPIGIPLSVTMDFKTPCLLFARIQRRDRERGHNRPARHIMIMGKHSYYPETKRKALGFHKVHNHDFNACAGLSLKMVYKHEVHSICIYREVSCSSCFHIWTWMRLRIKRLTWQQGLL